MFYGTFRCQCDRFRRLIERYPELEGSEGPEDQWSWREANGCDKPAVNAVAYFKGQELFRCAPKLVPDWCWPYLSIWQQWEQGTLAVEGGVLDQPAFLADCMRVISKTIADLQQSKREAPQPGGIPVGGKPSSRVPGAVGSSNAPAPSTGPHSGRARR